MLRLLDKVIASAIALSACPAIAQDEGPPAAGTEPASAPDAVQAPAALPAGICPPQTAAAETAGPGPGNSIQPDAVTPDLPADSLPAPGNGLQQPCVVAPVRPPPPDIFGLAAAPIGTRVMRQDWNGIRAASLENLSGPWDELLAQAKPELGRDPLDMVNRWVNWHVRFERDRIGDEWSSAPATLRRGFGDCEDFAIVKMALLERLGVAADSMFLVLIRERLRPVDHAVLAVRRGDRMLILDNRTDHVLQAEEITDYQPTLGFGGAFAWIYGQRIGKRDDSATVAESLGPVPQGGTPPIPAP